MTTTLLLTTGGILCALIGSLAGMYAQRKEDEKAMQILIERAEREGFEAGFERGVGRKDSNVVNY